MKKLKSDNNIGYCYVSFYVIAAAMLLIGLFSDLQIDYLLYNPDNFFAKFFELFAELPMFLVFPFTGTVFFYTRDVKNKTNNIVMTVFSVGMVLAGWVLIMFKLGDDWFGEDFSKILRIIIAVAFSALSILSGSLVNTKTMFRLRPIAVTAAVTVVITIGFGEVLKRVWGRARFRDMVNGVNGLSESNFSKWIIPQGLTGNRSFPSGHTYAAADTFVIISLADRFKKYKKYEFMFFCIAFVFTLLTAVARLVAGAHFLSDVTMGATLGFTVYILVRKYVQPFIFKFFGVSK